MRTDELLGSRAGTRTGARRSRFVAFGGELSFGVASRFGAAALLENKESVHRERGGSDEGRRKRRTNGTGISQSQSKS
jgi:hypothetical protein